MDIDKLFESDSLDGIADNVFGVVNNSVSEVKEMQRKKVAENVQLVVDALKKIESNISSRYDSVGNALEKRIITIKDGRDGADGRDGRNGKDGKNGRDGAPGPRGADGKNGLDGADGTDGVSVTNAHIDFDGSLVISLSSGHEINVGEVVAPALAEQIKVITNGGGTSQSVIDTLASLQAQITAISGASIYKGLWNASTNTPTLTSSVGTSGNFYIVSVAGSTNLNGITNWGVGDWAIYNGTAWQRVEGGAAGNFTTVTASSLTSGRVTYASTGGLLADSAALTWDGTTLAATKFSGALNGTVGATTPSTGAFTTLSATGTITASNTTALTVPNGYQTLYRTTNDTSSLAHLILYRGSGAGAYGAIQTTGDAANGVASLNLNFNGTDIAKVSSTGLAVTGTLTSTGNAALSTSTGGVSTIGTATPSAWATGNYKGIEINGGASFIGFVGNAQTYMISNLYNDGTNYRYINASGGGLYAIQGVSSGAHAWYSAPVGAAGAIATTTQTMTLDSSGNLLVGTTSAVTGSKLVVGSGDATIYGLTVGRGAGAVSTNTAFGSTALAANTTGFSNVAIGSLALNTATITGGNTAVGASALRFYARTASSIGRNTAIGQSALSTSTDGVNNTAVGWNTLSGTTGDANTALGANSGNGITSGSYNVVIGAYDGSTAPISATGSNYVVLSDGGGNIVASSKTAQTFALQGGTLSTGTGIAFPATQSASTDANTLDDYEEGTWTPNQGSGLIVVGAFSSVGNYVKIGRVVTVQGYLSGATSVSVAGGFNILTSNLPFSCNTNQTPAYAGNGSSSAFAGTYVNAFTIASIEAISATGNIYFFATYYTST